VREAAQLVGGVTQLHFDLVEARQELLILIWPELSAQETHRKQESDETLLGAVVEVTLEPAALGVTGFDDAGARRAEILKLRPHLGLETPVLEPEARGRRNVVDELRVVEQIGPVEQHGDWPTFAKNPGRSAPLHAGKVDSASLRVRVALVSDWIGDLELRVGKRSRERLP